MKTRSLVILSLTALAVLAASHRAYAATESAARTKPAAPADAAKAKPVLDKGMDGDAILQSYGKPYEIKPMEAPDKDVKVERWIYRRKVNESTTQTPVGYTTVTPPNASMDNNGTTNSAYIPTTQIPIYKLKRTTTYQVTDLLMVDNKLVLAKQRAEREEAFE